MKRYRFNKGAIVGAIVAIAGSAIAISTTYAIYVKTPGDISFTIGAQVDGDLNYSISIVSDDENALNPELDRSIVLDLGATNSSVSTYTQANALAKLSVTISSESEAFITALADNSTVDVGTGDTDYFGSYWQGEADFDFSSAEVVSGATYYVEASKSFPIPVDESGDLQATLTLSIGDMDIDTFLAVNEASFSVDVELTAIDEDYDIAVIVGDFNEWSPADSIYEMVPNPKADSYQWMWDNDTGEDIIIPDGSYYKTCMRDANTWCADNNDSDHYGSNEGNWYMSSDYQFIYWDGGNQTSLVLVNSSGQAI